MEWRAPEYYHITMEFSVIVPFSDARLYLRDCAHSLRLQLQERRDTEVIFADAGSKDGSQDFLQSHFPEFSFVSSATRHPYVARNLAARAAKGRILAFTDADCAVGPRWISAIHEAVSSGADLVTGPVLPAPGASSLTLGVHHYENIRMEEMCSRGSRSVAYAYTNNLAVRAEVFRLLGGFDATGERGGDSEFVLRALRSATTRQMVYSRDMAVTHLEVKSLNLWWRKKFLYGRSGTAGFARPSATALTAGGSAAGAGVMFALLIGRMFFGAGRLFARGRFI